MSTIQDVLANIHVDIGNPSGGDNGVTLPVGDDLFVAPNVDIVDGSSVSFDVYCAGTGSAQIDGDLSGANGVVFAGQLNSLGQAAGKTTIDIGPTGSVQTFSDPSVYAAVEIQNGDFSVTNDGFIDSASAGIAVDSKQPTNASDPGTGTIDNLGRKWRGRDRWARFGNRDQQRTNHRRRWPLGKFEFRKFRNYRWKRVSQFGGVIRQLRVDNG